MRRNNKVENIIGFIALKIRNTLYIYFDEAKENGELRGNQMTVLSTI